MKRAALFDEAEGVVGNVFDEFLRSLEGDTSIDRVIIERLRDLLHGDQDLSLEGFRKALFGDPTLP